MKRYDLVSVNSDEYHHDHVMEEDKTGEYVTYDDHQQVIEAVRDALKLALKHMAHSSPNCMRLLPTEEWSEEKGNRDNNCECEISRIREALILLN